MNPLIMMEGASSIPSAFTDLLTAIWSNVDSMVATITASAVLLIPVGFVFVRKTIAAGKSLMGTGGKRR